MVKISGLFIVAAFLASAFFLPAAYAGDQVVLKTQQDRDNYQTGVEFVRDLKKKGGTINLNLVIKGMEDELSGNTQSLPINDGPAVSVPEQVEYASGAPAGANAEHKALRIPAGSAAASSSPAEEGTMQTATAGLRNGSAAPAGSSVAAAQHDAAVAQLAAEGQQEGRIAPNGSVLSRRNEAIMRVRQLKASMRAGQ